MKAVAMNESEGGYQELTGFTRVKGNRGLGGNATQAYWDKVLGEIMDKLGGEGTSEGCDYLIGVVTGGGSGDNGGPDCSSSSLYGLYTTMNGAAFGWGRTFGRYGTGKGQAEHSGLIYSVNIKGTKYFGFTRAVRFAKGSGENTSISSPGPVVHFEYHKPTLPPGATIEAYIHIHTSRSRKPSI
jgi:hypothetical protein